MPSPPYSTLVESLQARANQNPDRIAYTYLADGETQVITLNAAQIELQARTVAAQLRQRCSPGDRAVLLYGGGLDPIPAFFGCLYAGVVAVPAFPLIPNRPPTAFLGLLQDAQTDLVLTQSALYNRIQPLFAAMPALGALRWVMTDTLDSALAADWHAPRLKPDAPALLLYTSGSTSFPKGVIITHANLLAFLDICREINPRHTTDGSPASLALWAPLYHGSGLIGAALSTYPLGMTALLLPPQAVIERPLRWLQALSRYRVTYSGGPGFIFQFCVDKTTPAERAGLDLSSLQGLVSGGEPTRFSAVSNFAETFAPYGFRSDAFATAYGLSETTTVVTQTLHGLGIRPRSWNRLALMQNKVQACAPEDPAATLLVSSGHTILDTTVRIVDPDTCLECPPNRVGEVWVAGPNVAAGYWNKPAETESTFHAHLAGSGAGPFLRTGDLGFLSDGELYITGRLKDVIIVHGHNYYAQDIEAAVALSHPALLPGAAAAFSVPGGDAERVVLFQELKPQAGGVSADAIAQAIRRGAAESLQLPLYAVVLVQAGTLPRTGMGKIQRYVVRTQFLESQPS